MLWVVVVAACNSEPSSTLLPLCAVCTHDTDCESGGCRLHGDDFHRKCSHICTSANADDTCSSPALGCATNGFCACKPIDAPPPTADACVGCDSAL
jgi:hypothetical protein